MQATSKRAVAHVLTQELGHAGFYRAYQAGRSATPSPDLAYLTGRPPPLTPGITAVLDGTAT